MFDETKGDNLETFIERLPETIAWCSRVTDVSDLAKAFRSDRLEPWLWADGRKEMIERVASLRNWDVGRNAERDIRKLPKGRLLVYYPDLTLEEGVPRAETRGFFDDYDAPPWDTWVAYFCETERKSEQFSHSYLVSWIPEVLIDIVTRGIGATSSTECIEWLDKSPYLAIYEMLKERDLL
jgi:hypothetical protein